MTSPPSFSSSLTAFNLPVRSVPNSNGSTSSGLAMQLDPSSLESSYPLYTRNAVIMGTGVGGVGGARKQSMLGSEIIRDDVGSDDEAEREEEEIPDTTNDRVSRSRARSETDSPMILGSPSFSSTSSLSLLLPLSLPSLNGVSILSNQTPNPRRPGFSRLSESLPTSPISSSTSGTPYIVDLDLDSVESRTTTRVTPPPPSLGTLGGKIGTERVMSSEIGSDEASASNERVARPISRRPNLLPKPKSFLRVQRTDDGPGEEIASEASLHRLSRSGTAAISISCPRPNLTSLTSSPHSNPTSAVSMNAGGALSSSLPLSHSHPTRNRFPEHAEEDEDLPPDDDSDDSGEGGTTNGGGGGEELASDSMSMGYLSEEEERRTTAWAIRGSSHPNSIIGLSMKSPGRAMIMDSDSSAPSTPAWHQNMGRPGKRKLVTEERFEPYAHAFKRRAVSPASTTSGSPILSFAQNLLSLPASTNSLLPLPISIPSPTLGHHHSFFNSLNHPYTNSSRGASPVPSSLSSSAGRTTYPAPTLLGLMSGRAERESQEEKNSTKIAELGNMNLG